MASPTTPPTAPPTMAPILLLEERVWEIVVGTVTLEVNVCPLLTNTVDTKTLLLLAARLETDAVDTLDTLATLETLAPGLVG